MNGKNNYGSVSFKVINFQTSWAIGNHWVVAELFDLCQLLTIHDIWRGVEYNYIVQMSTEDL